MSDVVPWTWWSLTIEVRRWMWLRRWTLQFGIVVVVEVKVVRFDLEWIGRPKLSVKDLTDP